MKNTYKIAFCFILLYPILNLLLVHAQNKPKGSEWKVPEKEALKKSEIKFDDAAIKEGKDIWGKSCKSCHGAKGLGDGAKAEKIDISCGDFSTNETQDLSDGSLYWKITNGRNPMPAFTNKLTDTERWQVVAFIRTLKKAGSTTSSTSKITKEKTVIEKEVKVVKKDTVVVTTTINKTVGGNILKPDSVTANIKFYTNVWDEIINKGRLDLINDSCFTTNLVMHQGNADVVGLDSTRAYYSNFLTGFSNINFTIKDVFGQGDKIVKYWNFKGTHSGVFFGIPATGKTVNIDGVTLVRMEKGKIAEERDVIDNLEFMQQLGVIPR